VGSPEERSGERALGAGPTPRGIAWHWRPPVAARASARPGRRWPRRSAASRGCSAGAGPCRPRSRRGSGCWGG